MLRFLIDCLIWAVIVVIAGFLGAIGARCGWLVGEKQLQRRGLMEKAE